jgi:Protein of unknown function (DUF4242)
MRFAVSEMMISPSLPAPMTYDNWMKATESLDGCMEARSIQWLYSLVSVQGDRSLCVYQVPDAEALREAYHEAGMPFQQIWTADLWVAKEPQSFSEGATLIVAESNFDSPMTKTRYEAASHQAKGCLDELNVESAFSIMALDGMHSVCLYLASSAEQVRSLYRKVGMPFECVWKASLIQPMSESVGSPHTMS